MFMIIITLLWFYLIRIPFLSTSLFACFCLFSLDIAAATLRRLIKKLLHFSASTAVFFWLELLWYAPMPPVSTQFYCQSSTFNSNARICIYSYFTSEEAQAVYLGQTDMLIIKRVISNAAITAAAKAEVLPRNDKPKSSRLDATLWLWQTLLYERYYIRFNSVQKREENYYLII